MLIRVALGVILLTLLGAGILFFTGLNPIMMSVFAYMHGNYAARHYDDLTARHAYEEALPHFPFPSWVYLKMGDLETRHNRLDAALIDYRAALKTDPKANKALIKVARTAWQEKDQTLSLQLYSQVMAANPHKTDLMLEVANHYLARAKATQNASDYAHAADLFEKALMQNPQLDDARYALAESLFAQADYDGALDQYCTLVVKHPDSPEALYSLGIALAKKEAYHEAAMALSQAAEHASDADQTHEWAAQAFRFQQRAGEQDDVPLPQSVAACWAKHPLPAGK